MVVGQNWPRLLEREAELSFLADRLNAVLTSGRGGTVAIEGAAGVGKTAVLAELARRGSPDGPVVLPAAGGELEQDLSWGVVRELFGRHLRQLDASERDRVLAGGPSARRRYSR